MAEKVTLPLEVYKAFENLKAAWTGMISEDEFNTILLNINSIGKTVGDAEVLRRYSQKNSTNYIRAIANGYIASEESDLVIQVHDRLQKWLDKSYECDESEDRMEFAKELTGYIKEQLATQ